MNILLLAKKNPYPPNDGEAIAIMQMAKGLVANGHQVSVLCMNTPKHNYPVEQIPDELQIKIKFYAVWVDNKVSVGGALANLFKKKPYHLERFYNTAFQDRLIKLLATTHFDIIQCEGLFLTAYLDAIRKYSNAKIIYRSHNIESNIWKRFAVSETNRLKKIYFSLQAKRLSAYEKTVLTKTDAVVPISQSDTEYYLQLFPQIRIRYNPTGIDDEKIIADDPAIDVNKIYFLGALDWLPNRQGLFWFLKEIFPSVLKSFPAVSFHIAGRNAPQGLDKKLAGPGIVYHGEIKDAGAFVSDKLICIVPLLSGSGMKIKIPEAMAAAKLVITTPVGAEGLPEGIDDYLEVCKGANEFIIKLGEAISHADASIKKANEGRNFVLHQFNNKQRIAELTEFYKSLYI